MSTEENKALLRRYIKEVWDKQNPAAVDEFLAPDYKRHRSPTIEPLTRDDQKQLLTKFRAAFPDIQLTVEEIIAEDDRWHFARPYGPPIRTNSWVLRQPVKK